MSDTKGNEEVLGDERESLGIYGQPKKRKRRRLKWILLILVAIVLVVGSIPWIVSTALVRHQIVAFANEKYEGSVQVGNLLVSWTGPCLIKQVLVRDKNGYDLFKVDQIHSSGGLLRLLIANKDLGTLEVRSPVITLRQEAQPGETEKPGGESTVPGPAKPKQPLQLPEALQNYRLRCLVTDAQVSIDQFDANGVLAGQTRVDGINATLELNQGDLTSEVTAKLAWNQQPNRMSTAIRWTGKTVLGWKDFRLQGLLELKELAAQLDKTTLVHKRIGLDYDCMINPVVNSVAIEKLNLDSQLLTLGMTGNIETGMDKIQLALKGQYEADWDRLLAVAEGFVPDLRKNIQLRGKSQGELALNGPLVFQADKLDWSGLMARLELGWDGAQVYGQEVGPTRFAPVLNRNELLLQPTAIPVQDGSVQLAGLVNLGTNPPSFKLDQPLGVLQNIPLNYALSWQLLSYINPLFYQVADIKGRVSMRTNEIAVPLDKTAMQELMSSGQVRLEAIQIEPKGLLLEICQLAGVDSLNQVTFEPLDFKVQQGKLQYDNFALRLNKDIQIKFSGAVGFDDKVNLKMTMPVTTGLLKRAGIKGNVGDYLTALGATNIVIPLRGTRQEPKLDLAAVDFQKLIEQAGRGLIQKQADDLLRDIIRKDLPGVDDKSAEPETPKTPDQKEPTQPDGTTPQPEKPKTPEKPKVEDIVIDLLRDVIKKR